MLIRVRTNKLVLNIRTGNLLIRTPENKDTCIIHPLSYGPKWCLIRPGKSGHLDNQDICK